MMSYKVAILIFCFVNMAHASSQEGTITSIQVRDDGLHWFNMNGSRTERPSCTSRTYWMIKDESSTFGKAQFSMLLSAYMSGKKVKVYGKNTCSRWHDGEDVATVQLR